MKSKRKWSKRWFRERRRYSNANLLEELKVYEPADYRNYLRMNDECFEYILNKIRYRIEKVNTIMRESVTAEERLAATLRYLGTGNSYEDLKFSTAISPQLLSKIIPEACTVLYEELSKEGYLKVNKHIKAQLKLLLIKIQEFVKTLKLLWFSCIMKLKCTGIIYCFKISICTSNSCI